MSKKQTKKQTQMLEWIAGIKRLCKSIDGKSVLLRLPDMYDKAPKVIKDEGYKWLKNVYNNYYKPTQTMWLENTPTYWAFVEIVDPHIIEVVTLYRHYKKLRSALRKSPVLFRAKYDKELTRANTHNDEKGAKRCTSKSNKQIRDSSGSDDSGK